MPTPKLNPSRSIAVIPSDYCNIPNPALFNIEHAATHIGVGSFSFEGIDTAKVSIKTGDIVYSGVDGIGATITSVVVFSPTRINFRYNNPVAFTEGTTVQIYTGEDDSTGCVLYVGSGGDMSITTEGGDDVVLISVPTGSFVPVQVLKIYSSSTSASNILALR